MANKFFAPGRQRAAKVGDLFATVARRYDLINDLQSFGMHRYWKRQLTELAKARAGERALDICCGTGDVAFALAGRGSWVAGLDFSMSMLNVARGKNKERSNGERHRFSRQRDTSHNSEVASLHEPGNTCRQSLSNAERVSLLHGDAMNIPFADGAFDLVTISYGLRNLASFDRGLREMWRVARPGGRLLVLDFGKPDNVILRSFYFGYLKWFVPVFGRMFCEDGQTYGYIFESLRHYPAQNGVAAKMREMNCAGVRVVNLLGGVMSLNYGIKQ